ncbi:methyl-accepting chemotaxis protein [Desulfohalotomaculum tongense]|uniref:methyl-accepting chemotaxis protein n=1 Tax=Desulforadius tongensis TaxID=1216062 RepID=UPI00195B2B6E|nr:methyl-accepting chemotaxis protein [Desulforadius tongensis]MBM7853986.1 methyl-accepting chemotaxis protein [Desulforadius tongensis]
MKLKTKLILNSLVILLLLIFVGVFSVVQIQKINDSYNRLFEKQVRIKDESKELVINFEYSALYMRSYLFTGNPDYKEKYRRALKAAYYNLETLQNLVTDEKGKQKVVQLEQSLNEFTAYAADGMKIMGSGPEAVVDFTLNRKGTINGLIKTSVELAKMQEEIMQQQIQANTRLVNSMGSKVMVAVVSAFIISLIITLITAKRITDPVVQLEREFGRMAQGDLTGEDITAATNDEIGSLTSNFNSMKKSLQQIVQGLNDASRHVVSSSETLSAAAQQTSSGVQEVTAAMNEISAAVINAADNAGTVSNAADQTAKLAANGSKGIDKIEVHMDNISEVSSKVSEAVDNLNQSSKEITRIVDMITEIAEQTNLLALNATIEAARAGEQGRGFAVVAEEVRKLAENSARAANEIYRMISDVKQESEYAVSVMKANTDEVANSRRIIQEVGSYFKDIIDKIQALAKQVHNIAESTSEISARVQNVSSVTEEQSASMQEVSALAQQLNGMAEELNRLAGKFKI